jgi:hypothetical protein
MLNFFLRGGIASIKHILDVESHRTTQLIKLAHHRVTKKQ